MSKKVYFLYFAFLIFAKGFSQDPLFFNAQQSLVYLNPSFAGSNGGIRNQFTYRAQWPNLSGMLLTYQNSFDAYLPKIKGGIFVSALHDDQAHGTLTTDVLSMGYAQHLSFLDGKLKIFPSVQASYFKVSLDKTKLNFGEPVNLRFPDYWTIFSTVPVQNKSNIDFSSGLLINYKNFYFGTSVFHINQPDQGLLGTSKLPYRLSLHSSYNLHVSEKTVLNFFARYEKQQYYEYLHLSAKALLLKHLIIGTGYTSYNGINLNAGYRNNFYVLTLGYDVSITKLSGNTAASWELQASFNLRNKEQRKVLTDFERW
jgi:type IX secretion system PorP/SprF family membrane protein